MSRLSNTATANQVAFGQLGAVYTKTSGDAIKPPTGRVFVAIQMLENTTFDDTGGLVAEVATLHFNTESAAGDNAADSETAAAGSGGQEVPQTQTFPKGMTIYGRWTEVDVLAGAVIAYIG